ncbi:hypothetical protein LCGC14_2471640 [marine sediment metagenome]|uniref:HNH nuclease domain-containing protein n=1 Tax=marine sediment metagenome TaxID=412755 RepID=A0A0F9E435_9ZZZZ
MKRFWDKVDNNGKDSFSDCWNWIASKDKDGYGRFFLNGKHRKAHRVSFALWGFDVPDNRCVLHRCDNPACVNPAHLFLGTNKENSQDMVRKGRQANKKLSDEDVLWIRQLGGTTVQLAKCFGVAPSLISMIKSGQRREYV